MKNIKQIGLFSLGIIFSNFSFSQKTENQPTLSNGSKIENSLETKPEQNTELKSTNKLNGSKIKAKKIKNTDIELPKLSDSEKKETIE